MYKYLLASVVAPEGFILDPEPPIIFKAYLEIIEEKNALKSVKKKNLLIICHFLFHTTVLQYTQSGTQRPKISNSVFIYLLFHFLLDPDLRKSSGFMRIRIHNTAVS